LTADGDCQLRGDGRASSSASLHRAAFEYRHLHWLRHWLLRLSTRHPRALRV